MVRDAVLWKIVGSDLFLAPACADLSAPLRTILLRFLPLPTLQKARSKNTQRLLLVLQLTSGVLASNDRASWYVHHLDRRVGSIHSLATGPSRTRNFDPEVVRFQFDVYFFGFRQNCHGRCRRVDSSLCFSRRNSLHAVNTAFEAKFPKHGFTGNLKNDFLQTAQLGRTGFENLGVQSGCLGITIVESIRISASAGG